MNRRKKSQLGPIRKKLRLRFSILLGTLGQYNNTSVFKTFKVSKDNKKATTKES